MEYPETLRYEWLAAGWKRGAFIDLKNNEYLLDELPKKIVEVLSGKKNVFLIPILYDCALVDIDFIKEPWAQVVVVWEEAFDGNFANAKNPRKLHFKTLKNENELNFEVSALSFSQLDREVLLRSSPDRSMSWPDGGLEQLLDWAAERFRQATFPDSFNRRLGSIKKLFSKIWKSENFCTYSSGVYFSIHTYEELPEEKQYEIKVLILIPYSLLGKEYRNFDKNVAPDMIAQLKIALDSIKSLKLIDIDTISEREFTKEVEREFSRYSLESFTYASVLEGNPLPAEFVGA